VGSVQQLDDVYIHKVILVVMIVTAVDSYSLLQEICLFFLQLDFMRKG